jgi:hypothetical protein
MCSPIANQLRLFHHHVGLTTKVLALRPRCYCCHATLQIPSPRPTNTPAGFVGAGVGVWGSDGATGGATPGTAGVAGVSGSCSC